MKPPLLICAASLCAFVCASPAQSVYRCGADGRTYSQEPCEAGRLIDVADGRSAQQAAQTRQAAQRDAQLAQALQREREAAERQAARQAPALIGTAKTAPPGTGHCDAARPHRCAKPDGHQRRHGPDDRVTLYRAPDTR
jgi:hypothetical protein